MIDGFREIAINLVAGVVLVILGTMSRAIYVVWETRSERRLWRPFRNKSGLTICLTTRPGPLPRSTQRVSLAEVGAISILTPMLQRLKIPYRLAGSIATRPSDLARENLLVMGSTFANGISCQIADLMGGLFPVKMTEEPRTITFFDKVYTPTYSEDLSRVLQDYAVIIRNYNPFDVTRLRGLFLVMGCHGFGTEGAAHLLAGDLENRRMASETGPFAALIRVRVVGDTYQHSILEVAPLPNA